MHLPSAAALPAPPSVEMSGRSVLLGLFLPYLVSLHCHLTALPPSRFVTVALAVSQRAARRATPNAPHACRTPGCAPAAARCRGCVDILRAYCADATPTVMPVLLGGCITTTTLTCPMPPPQDGWTFTGTPYPNTHAACAAPAARTHCDALWLWTHARARTTTPHTPPPPPPCPHPTPPPHPAPPPPPQR